MPKFDKSFETLYLLRQGSPFLSEKYVTQSFFDIFC